ncbi:MAG: glycosyltransferase [Candidatus Omnitrophica bacterium]|nr:glycosyltransferase [Candidatus Omnitrophota bacterium]
MTGKRTMKVIFCAYDRPGYIASGPNVWLKRLVPDLVARGVQVHTLFIYHGEDEEECPTIKFFKQSGLSVSSLSSKKHRYVEEQIRWIIEETSRHDGDILVANLVVPAYYAGRYLKRYGVKVIGVQHSVDSFYDVMYENFLKGKKKDALSGLVTVSEYLREKAETNNRWKIPVLRIPCGTPLAKEHSSFSGQRFKMVYLGPIRIVPKRITEITRAFCELSGTNENLRFSIYGEGPDAEKVRQMIKEYEAENKVIYYGPIDPAEVLGALKEHHVFTLMSDWEGMPIALLEAMSCGVVPVCLTEKSGINEVVKHEYNGMIVKDRKESYYEAINRLNADRGLWRRLSDNAIQTIKEEYSSEINNKKWYEFLISFNNGEKRKKRMSVPVHISLIGLQPFVYGDLRRPPVHKRLRKKLQRAWTEICLILRPRSRIRELFSSNKGGDIYKNEKRKDIKIAFYTTSYPPKSGGIAASNYHLINLLREHFQIKVFVFNDGNNSREDGIVRRQTPAWIASIVGKAIMMYLKRYKTNMNFPNCRRLFRMAFGIMCLNGELKKIDPDIILVPDHYIPAYWMKKPVRSKVVWMAKNNYHRFRGNPLLDESNWADWDIAFSMERRAILKADAMISPSKFMMEFSEKTHACPDIRKVIHDLIDKKTVRELKQEKEISLFNNEYPVVYIPSGGTANKGKRYVFEIIRGIASECGNKVNFFISGHIPHDLIYELKHIKEVQVFTPGHSDWETNIKRVSGCDLMVSPTLIENFSNAFLEAFCLGMPVVTFDVGGNKEIIDDGENGYVVPYLDVDALISKASELILEVDKLKLFSEKSKAKLDSLIDKGSILKQFTDLFDELRGSV